MGVLLQNKSKSCFFPKAYSDVESFWETWKTAAKDHWMQRSVWDFLKNDCHTKVKILYKQGVVIPFMPKNKWNEWMLI